MVIDGVRELPKNIEAEQNVLGCLILEPERVWPLVSPVLASDMFHQRRHRVLYDTMCELMNKAEPCDVVSLANRLEERGDMERAGGRLYLNELVDRVTTTASVEYYAEIVWRKAALRSLIEAGGRIAELGYDETNEIDEVLGNAEALLLRISRSMKGGGIRTLAEIVGPTLDHMTAVIENGFNGLPSGLTNLDHFIRGFRPGLYVIAGRPGMGKTTLGLDIAYRQAGMAHPEMPTRNIRPGIISIEMEGVGLVERLASRELGRNWEVVPSGTTKMEWLRSVNAAIARVRERGIVIDDRPHNSIQTVAGAIYEMLAKHKVDIIYIDYIQLVGHADRYDNREQELAAVMRKLAHIRKEAEIPLVVLAQLNRKCEDSADKRPMLSHLRESGAIEQDADVVILCYNPGKYDMEGAHELIIAKNRQGSTGTVYVDWNQAAFTFRDSTWTPRIAGTRKKRRYYKDEEEDEEE